MLSIIVPVYNEEKIIPSFHEELTGKLDACGIAYELVYVNDGSTDGSLQKLNETGARVLSLDYNRGYGAAIKIGMRRSRGERIAIIDCDGTYDPADLVNLHSEMGDRDMVIGRRPGEKWLRGLAKWFLQGIASYAVGCRIPDLNSGLRIFTRETATRLFSLLPNGFSLSSTLTLGALYVPFSVCFIPISYRKRSGSSKIRPIGAIINFTMLIIRTIILFNPLKFFLPASILLALGGTAFLVRDILAANVAQSSLLMLINAFILLAIGLLAEAIRHRE